MPYTSNIMTLYQITLYYTTLMSEHQAVVLRDGQRWPAKLTAAASAPHMHICMYLYIYIYIYIYREREREI